MSKKKRKRQPKAPVFNAELEQARQDILRYANFSVIIVGNYRFRQVVRPEDYRAMHDKVCAVVRDHLHNDCLNTVDVMVQDSDLSNFIEHAHPMERKGVASK